MAKNAVFTFQTRIPDHPALDAYGELFGRLERSLFGQIAPGREISELKPGFCKSFQVPARVFNSASISVRGKSTSVQEGQPALADELKERIERSDWVIRKTKSPFKLHQKKRWRAILQSGLEALKADIKSNKVRIAFGSKKLFRSQFALKANGYKSHEDWLADWQRARSGEFLVVGSKDETGGFQVCFGSIQEDGLIGLKLRLPDALRETFGKYLPLENLDFHNGHQAVLDALVSCLKYSALKARRRREGRP